MKISGEEEMFPHSHATFKSYASSYLKKGQMKLFGKVSLSEKDILIGCMNGDAFFQKALYDKHASKMFGICLRYAPDYHTAEDILQEGFIKVYKSIVSFRNEGSFEGWMRRIFVNLSIERYRRTKGVVPFEEISDHTYYLFDTDASDNLEVDDLLKMIQELPNGYREVFNLFAIEGFSHAEIGELLGINEGTSKSQLSRARNLLKKKINEQNLYLNDTLEQLGQIG